MITTCTNCNARYRLDGDKVPRRLIRVRCPGCNGVFHLDGTVDQYDSLAEDPTSGFVTGFQTNAGQSGFATSPEPSIREMQPGLPPPAPEVQPAPLAAAPAPRPSVAPPLDLAPAFSVTAPSAPAAQMVAPGSEAPTGGRRRRNKEEMLARALVSDILVYNRDLRDAALAEGNLVQAMGAEIKKSWELYKEKVTPEVANSNDYFREALNDILAEGSKIF